MQITTVEPANEQGLRDLLELERASYRVDRPHLPPPTLAEITVNWTRPYPGSILVPLQARLDGRLAGYAWLSLAVVDNTENATVDIVVHPDLRRRGIGTALAAAAVEQLSTRGRKVAIGNARTDGPGAPFAVAVGALAQQDQVRNMLYLDAVDAAVVSALLADAQARAAGYTLMCQIGPTAQRNRAAVAVLYQVMNDAPHESDAMEDERWTSQRVADADEWRAARGDRVYSIVARAQESSQPAALTRVAVRPAGDLAFQLETGVAAEHRGRRLGYLLKASMLNWLRTAEPQVRRICTFNAASNSHMIAINETLGFVPVERWKYFQLAV